MNNNPKLNVFIFHHPSFRCGNYGIGTYLKTLSDALKLSEKIKLHLVYLEASNYKEVTFNEENDLTFLYIPPPLVFNEPEQPAFRQLYALRVADLLEKYFSGYDNLVFQFNLSYEYFLAKELKQRFNCKVIFVVHCFQWYFDFLGNEKRYLEWSKHESNKVNNPYQYDRLISELADHVTCVTSHARKYLIKNLGIPIEKTTVIHNGIDVYENYYSGKDINTIKKKLGFRKSDKIVLFVGRIDKTKGIPNLLNAFRAIVEKAPETHLVIIGEAHPLPITHWLNKCEGIWRNIHFIGYLPAPIVYDFYKIANVGVIPSLFEWCSYVALEMMKFKLPVIATRTGGLSEIYEQNKTALLIDITTAENGDLKINEHEFSEAVLSLLKSKKKSKMMIEDAFERLKYYFANTIMADKYLEEYQRVIK